ncbi:MULTISPECIES: ROK family protein [Lacticaseibacillus]|uniref:fructokinase n=2 Tax=Lacticaseibacillus TaxID=2759736 RepID=A0AAN1F0I2_LACCA|nr:MULTISPECIES: ROK family protein [Lacticaseibacillus]ARY92536.1 fructokinase [Lacticaseibacillus casei]KAB1969625.1 ROK family protein [Lacticaseibacillus casei]WLV80437.1 ROK family protein [Lacticaseibacillus sp. NCIMB 15473]WNX24398.1 ROK family protein [Lacticaseibacillus casei]WNX27170.1 ROK family protein [Lacticaseibacillus casei]
MTAYGSIEAGGTKFVLAVADEKLRIVKRKQIKTSTPPETLQDCIDFFTEYPVDALGIGSFGPADIIVGSPRYGHILNTPKPGWTNTDIVGAIENAHHVPVFFTTDVNASAYGEYMSWQNEGIKSLVYFTIGTGIGGGAIQNGHFIGGMAHLEMGHTAVRAFPGDDFEGVCPYHGNRCFEGMASGPAIAARTGIPGEQLDRSNPVFRLISYYVAQLTFDAYLNLAPAKIVIGGSVVSETELPQIYEDFNGLNAGYVNTPALSDLIVLSRVPNNGSATMGDFALAKQMLASAHALK